jgi:endonuclease/exonuclease/phosphatase family metal-dependent hydrolase
VRFLRTTPFVGLGTLIGALALGACESNATNNPVPDGGHGGSGAGGGTGTPQLVTILNWNVRNLVDDESDGFASETIATPAEYNAHRQAVGTVLAALDPDIAVLQEVEGLDVLGELNSLELGGRYTELALAPGNDPRGVDVALLSRLPVDQVVTHKDDTFTVAGTAGPLYRYARDCLELHFTINGRKVVLFGVHYKAKENDDPNKRLAEAQHTRALADAITGADPTTGALILGDFNDTPGSLPYTWTTGTFQNAPELYTNAPDSVPAADRWTMNYQGNLELVDQQMSSPVLAAMLDTGSVQILHGSEVDAATDHAPVMATYEIR